MATKSAQPEPEKAEVIEELLDTLDTALDRVKVLYEQYFLGIQKQPPTHLHSEIERKLRDVTQMQIRNTGLRYRFATIQQKFGSYNAYWRRTVKQIENGTYARNLSKIGRQAVKTGREIPEEILAAMPKRMREQVKRDREAAIAIAKRRDLHEPPEEVIEPDADGSDEPVAIISEPSELRQSLRPQGPHVLDDADGDFDLEAFFADVTSEPAPVEPVAPPIVRAATIGPGRKTSPSMPVPVVPRPAGTGAIPSMGPPPTRAPSAPPVSDARLSPPAPAPGMSRPAPPPPAPGMSRPAPPAPGMSRPAPPAPAPGTPRPAPPPPAAASQVTRPIAITPSQATQPNPVIAAASQVTQRNPIIGAPSQVTRPIPIAPSQVTRPNPIIPAPSQVTRPIPIVPGASVARPATPVESMAGPFARTPIAPSPPRPAAAPPVGARPIAPNMPIPKPPSEPALRPPPGMSDADVNALYGKYVKAKEMVGETAGPGAYGKLLKTINATAPKIMEQYKSEGVEFSIVVKDNQVIIKAKPKT